MKYPQHLLKLIETLKRLPGVGTKTAERFAFHMLEWNQAQLEQMAEVVRQIPHELRQCMECGCLIGESGCQLCESRRAEQKVICLIASSKDVYAIEQTHQFKGLYHVLGSLISPLEGKGPEKLPIDRIRFRVDKYQIEEMIIALDSTLEGDATALYLKKEFGALPLKISRLALGLPMGSSLDYVDGGTLARAFSGRSAF